MDMTAEIAACGKRLQLAREAVGITQYEMAEILNIGRAAYGNWEQGTRLPDPLRIAKLTRLYGITLDWVYMGELRGTPPLLATRIQDRQSLRIENPNAVMRIRKDTDAWDS